MIEKSAESFNQMKLSLKFLFFFSFSIVQFNTSIQFTERKQLSHTQKFHQLSKRSRQVIQRIIRLK